VILDLQYAPGSNLLPPEVRGGALSVGNFDGVHRGHAALLGQLCQVARRHDGPSVVVTFDPHPAALLRPGSEPPRLTTPTRRAHLLTAVGVDYVVVCHTTTDLLQLTAEAFFDWLVIDQLGVRGMVEGPNFYFGRNRGGSPEKLAGLCQAHAIDLRIVSATHCPDDSVTAPTAPMVSSTRVRQLLSAGRVRDANALLTAPYRIEGVVVQGDQRGRQLGFPTANLAEIPTLIPASGVYSTRCHTASGIFAAATHVGPNLTFDDQGTPRVETHLLDFQGDLYGQTLEIEWVDRIRDITKFDSADKLVAQLHEDIDTARRQIGTLDNSSA
jgi:riboflavin kinase/FMN adenylyltransferase